MILLDAANAADYLRSSGRVDPGANVHIEPLAGGVSNVVLRVDVEGQAAFVIKQARERLRTDAPWFSRIDRIWREAAMMSALSNLLPTGAVPRILFDDRQNYLIAMEAIDSRHVVWKQELLAGRIDFEVARRLASYLFAIHCGTHRNAAIAQEFDDREIFAQLRVDPYYRHIARVHSDLRPHVEALIDEMWQTRACLVHADFSPKNVLIVNGPGGQGELRVTLVDFETGHYGDPAFDLGFFLSHLMLKGVHAQHNVDQFLRLAETFWVCYSAQIATMTVDPAFDVACLERRAVANLAGCTLARVDGTSPVDYLPQPRLRALVRAFAKRLFFDRVDRFSSAFALLESIVRAEGLPEERGFDGT